MTTRDIAAALLLVGVALIAAAYVSGSPALYTAGSYFCSASLGAQLCDWNDTWRRRR